MKLIRLRIPPLAKKRGSSVSSRLSSPLHTKTLPPGSALVPSGHLPPAVIAAAMSIAIVVLPEPTAPART
jgi:hypothetical protein